MLYPLLRPLLFCLDAEQAHTTVLRCLNLTKRLRLLTQATQIDDPIEVMGLSFPNRVGLAAGLDKNGEYIDALSLLGFGFLEIGTVTPQPQSGNAKPRLFRITQHQGIINRLGFNNNGVDALLDNIARSQFQGILGINIGKNATTPIDQAANDYLACLDKVYPVASYIAVNISSPNTQNLRQLQQSNELGLLLAQLKERQTTLANHYGHYVPLAIKIAPDLDDKAVHAIAQLLIQHRIDGVIATNTTLSRHSIAGHPLEQESGGLSGAPVRERSTQLIEKLAHALDRALPIVGVGGIMSASDACEKLAAGASLIQLYSGLIYQGPSLVTECARTLAQYTPPLMPGSHQHDKQR